MREKIKILDGPMEGEETQLDRRLMVLYDQKIITDDEDNKHLYRIVQNGLKYVKSLP